MAEIRQISFEQLPTNLQESINKIAVREGYTNSNISVKSISSNGNNFLGELYEVKIAGETSDGEKETDIFLKRIINNDDFKVYSIPEVYAKEAFVYNELSDVYNEIQNEANVPIEDRLKMVPSYEETSTDAIILNDITKKGYTPGNRFNLLTIDSAELSLKELAKFHALSFALEIKRPEYFENNIKTKKQSFIYDDFWNEFVVKMCEISIGNLSVDVKDRVRKFVPISLQKYPLYMTGFTASVKCLCHGDYKINNIMFKEENGVLKDVVPIDYQQIYYGNPIIDLIYFIYAASDRNFRRANLHHLKEFYYTSFSEFLNYFAIDAETVFPKGEFEKTFNDSLDYGLIFSLYFYPFFFASEDDSPDGNDELSDVVIKVDDRLHDRIQGVVDDFIDMGILK